MNVLSYNKALPQLEHVLDGVLNDAGIGIWGITPESGRIRLCPTARSFFKQSPEQAISIFSIMRSIVATDTRLILKGMNEACRKKDRIDTVIRVNLSPDEGFRWLKIYGKYVPGGKSGFGDELRGTVLDITEQKKEELRKEDYIALLNHELRSPLSTIKLYVQMVIKQAKSAQDLQTAEIMEKAEQQVGSMSRMIENFLTTSTLSNSKLQLFPQRFELLKLVNEITREVQHLHTGRRFEISFSGDAIIYADREKIAQVLINYLSNAVKYSPAEAAVSIHCKVRRRSVEVCVKDNGRGIAMEDQKKIFTRFFRTHPQGVKGFGLGLFLVKEIITSHGGKVWLESEPGIGSAFYFSLPLPLSVKIKRTLRVM